MVHTPAGVRARAKFPHTVCRIHVCMTTSAAAAAAIATGPFPPPVCPPPISNFFFKFKFLFKEKNYAPPQTHTLPFVQKKRTLTGFLATHTAHIKACALLKWYFDRQCNTYFTQNRFLYNIVLDLYCFGHGHLAARQPVCGLLGNEKYIPCMWLWNFRPHKTKSPGLDTTVLWPNETPTPRGSVLCLVRTETLVSTPGNQHWKKHYDLKRKTKSGLFKRNTENWFPRPYLSPFRYNDTLLRYPLRYSLSVQRKFILR